MEYFVSLCLEEMAQLEHWGCPWSRREDGSVNVRAFGGIKIECTRFTADKTGFHILHTLFQTSLQFPSIKRFDECFCVGLIVDDKGQARGVLAIEIASGDSVLIDAGAVVMASDGGGRARRRGTAGWPR